MTKKAIRTSVLILIEQDVLAFCLARTCPMWTRLTAIRKLWRAAPILICVCIDALMPIVLSTIRAPEGLKAVHVEAVCSTKTVLLIHIEELGTNLFPGMGKGAIATALTKRDSRVGGTKPLLEDLWVVQEL